MTKPLIVQSDNTLLLEVDNPLYEEVRDAILPFAELEKSPEHIHTYRITPLSLWNAASAGLTAKEIVERIERYSRYTVPAIVITTIKEQMDRYGLLTLIKRGENLILQSDDVHIIREIATHKQIQKFIEGQLSEYEIRIKPNNRGHIKQALIKIGFPVEDKAGYVDGDPCPFELRSVTASGMPFEIRDYQRNAIDSFYRSGSEEGGSGVVVLPCGAGKTIVGIGIMHLYQTKTLICVTNTVALRQWIDELLDKTTLTRDMIAEYSGDIKDIKPVTIATYNILTYRRKKEDEFKHFGLFTQNNWGLIIYDEVHLLPAPVFRMTAEIQSKRRLGLTATLVREDGLETDVFSLIGPKKFDMPWKMLEECNWIAKAICTEVRIELPESLRYQYTVAGDRQKFRIASENEKKLHYVEHLLKHHPNDRVLIIGQYIDQLEKIKERFGFPLITGSTPVKEREELYKQFKQGTITRLIVSKVANFSIDLPDANVAIQVSGTFGSRQEEAQRLGRILRPKPGDNTAYFYSLITAHTVEENFAHNRQLFLTEQGYTYIIMNESMFNEKFST
ncbi:MAG: DEAD/DEAH box helicase [Spirochaetota bacterium]|nr:DEAD/DEAH box helicase [Spirochaetota bacterium]